MLGDCHQVLFHVKLRGAEVDEQPAMVLVDRKACFSHDITQLIYAFPLHFLCPFVFLVANGCRLAIEPNADTECNRVDR